MALTEQQIDEMVEAILHGTQEKYVQEMSDALVDHLVQGFTKLGDEAALQQLVETFPSQAQTILNKYRDTISKEVQDEVEKTLSDSVSADLNQLESIYGQERADVAQAYFSLGATAHFANLAKTTAEQVADIVTRQNILMEQGAERMWYQVSQDAINEVVLGTKPYGKALSDGVVKLMDAGIGVIDYGSNGKATVSNMIDVALRRHIVSQVSQVGGRMSMEAMESYGHEFAITTAHFGARPSHAQWQGLPGCMSGEKTVDGTTYPDFYVLTGYKGLRGPNVALGDRLKGVNCKHGLHPFFPGITQLPDREFKAAQAKYHMTSDEYYEATQRQRELERRIRKTKREIVGLERAGLGLESPTYVQKRLVLGKQQRMLNKHCKDTGLVRLYNREKAYGVSSQPRALKSTSRNKARRNSKYKYPVTQQQIDSIIQNELSGIRFTAKPTYNGRIGTPGLTKIGYNSDGTKYAGPIYIGKQSSESKRELIDTLVHEELEARIWLNRHGSEKYWALNDADDDKRHEYIYRVVDKFIKIKGL